MPRYIDADALNAAIEEWFDGVCVYDVSPSEAVNDFQSIVDEQPTLSPDEVRGVVHCAECDLWNRFDNAGRESLGNFVCSCAHWTVEDGAVLYTKPTDFCSYGERMVSEDD